MVDLMSLLLYHFDKFIKLSITGMARKLIKKRTITLSETEEVTLLDDSTAVDKKKDIGILILQLIKKYLFNFVGKGEQNNGSSD